MTPTTRSFVMHFGEMSSRWGINRTVGQLYALLMVSEEPLHAEQVMEALKISRGNVSMALKELQSWQLIRVHHIPGDRKEYFNVAGDIWDMALKILDERRKREVEPTLSLLRDLLMNENPAPEEKYAQQKMQEIHDLMELLSRWSKDLQGMNREKLTTLMTLGAGVSKILDIKSKLSPSK